MEISKKQLIDMVRTAHLEGALDGRWAHSSHRHLNDTQRVNELWLDSDSLFELRGVLQGDKT